MANTTNNHARRWAWTLVALVCLQFAMMAGVYLLLGYQVHTNDHRWCDTLVLLTQKPVSAPPNPGANPSREGEYRLYRDFVTLKTDFGCD